MRKIITTTFLTLDGVMQAPGGPEEDTSNGFQYGGWMYAYGDDMTNGILGEMMHMPFELLLGKHTYDIFAAYWPLHNGDVATPFNSTKKYVVSHQDEKLEWNNSTLITGNVPAELKKLKEMGAPDLWVHGSGNLIQTLLKNHLIDEMHIWTLPLTVGSGKRLFEEGTQPQDFKLLDSKISPTGIIVSTYKPAGDIKLGTIGS